MIKMVGETFYSQLKRQNDCIKQITSNYTIWTPTEFENYLRKNVSYIEWFWVCNNYELSENFIREMKDYINWSSVFDFQIYHLKEDFINELIEHYDEFNIHIKPYNKNDTIRYIKRRLREVIEI